MERMLVRLRAKMEAASPAAAREPQFVCRTCGKKFGLRRSLIAHRLVHRASWDASSSDSVLQTLSNSPIRPGHMLSPVKDGEGCGVGVRGRRRSLPVPPA